MRQRTVEWLVSDGVLTLQPHIGDGGGGADGGGALTHPTRKPPLPSICPSYNLFSYAAATGITYVLCLLACSLCPLNVNKY